MTSVTGYFTDNSSVYMYGETFYGRHTAQIAQILWISNDIASTWERLRLALQFRQRNQPIELTGTTPNKVDRIALIYVICIFIDQKKFLPVV
jgi:hypothetical protein